MKRSPLRAAAMIFGFVLALGSACYLAYAYSTGISGQTRKNSPTAGCGAKVSGGGGCHGVNPDTNIQVSLSGPSALPLGTPGTYTIAVSGLSATGGGCDIAVSSGTLSTSSTLLQLLNQEITHVAPIATPFSIEFNYVSNSPGTVTMYANGKASAHWNWSPNLTIRIGAPPAPSLMSPVDGSSTVPTSLALTWSGIQGPKWKLEVSSSQLFSSVLVRQDSLTDTTYTIPEGALANNTQYFWRVSGTDAGGTSAWSQTWSFSTAVTGVEEGHGTVPTVFALEQNYPNPFNPTTVVRSQLPVASNVKLVVYDVQGREVAVLVNERRAAGRYQDTFDGTAFASGIYFYRLITGDFVQTKRLLLLK